MGDLIHDLRYGLRILLRAPGFTLAALATLGLGIGSSTAIVSLAHGILLAPFPYPEAERVVSVWNRFADKDRAHLAEPEFKAYRDRSESFEAMAAFVVAEGNMTGRGEPERVSAVVASAGIFATLGVEPVMGRFFTEEEDRPGAEQVVVISHELWRRLGADPALVGDKLMLDGVPFTVLGVTPPGLRMPHDFQFGTATDIWVPLGLDPAVEGDWGMHGLAALGRLRDGVSLARAQLDIDRVVAVLKREHAGTRDAIGYDSFGAVLRDLHDEVAGGFSPAIIVLLGAVAFVLLIACTNVANLLLTRSESRRRELALRSALGAGRSRLLRQLMTESLLLAVAGGALGVLIAHWLVAGIVALDPGNIPRLGEIRLDLQVLGISSLLTLATALGFGLLPALRTSGIDIQTGLRSGDRGLSTPAGRGLRRTLTIAEVSLAVVLIVGAGLMIRSLLNMQAVDPGFRTDGLLTLEVEIPASAYPDQASVAGFFNRLEEHCGSLPGVTACGGVTGLPLASTRGDWNFYPEGRVIPEGVSSPRGDWQVVTPGYFEALGVPLLAGRVFSPTDGPESPLGIVFNQELVQRYYPDEDPVGQRVRLGGNEDNPWINVIGVVGNVRHRGLDAAPRPEWYLSHAQVDRAMSIPPRRGFSMAIRSERPPERLIDEIRARIADLDPRLPLANVQMMSDIRSRSLAQPRFATALLAGFALLAVALGSIGIFGVVSYLVSQRAREIGVRLALGASPRQVLRMVLGEGLRMTGIGIVLGAIAALGLSRVLESQLHEVSTADPLTLGATMILLLLVAMAASLIPAGRAAGIDPIRVLRDE